MTYQNAIDAIDDSLILIARTHKGPLYPECLHSPEMERRLTLGHSSTAHEIAYKSLTVTLALPPLFG
jgi:hypothetical protein